MGPNHDSLRPQESSGARAPWNGHRAATNAVLDSILARRAGGAPARLTRPELDLVTACEFWAAAMNRGLFRYLAGSALLRLRAVEESFAGMHASEAKAAVHFARLRLKVAGTPAPLREISEQLEAELAALTEPVDDFIAEFVRHHVRSG